MNQVPGTGDFVKFFVAYRRPRSVKEIENMKIAYGSVMGCEEDRYVIDIIGPKCLRNRYLDSEKKKSIIRIDRDSVLGIIPPSLIDSLQKRIM